MNFFQKAGNTGLNVAGVITLWPFYIFSKKCKDGAYQTKPLLGAVLWGLGIVTTLPVITPIIATAEASKALGSLLQS